MTYQEALSYINGFTWSQNRAGLDRMRILMEKLGNPQRCLSFIHVAGSNGKGSTCAMLAGILEQAGYRTGLYSSPHIEDFCERIQINRCPVPKDVLCEITEYVRQYAEQMAEHVSMFELTTAIAFEYFARKKCDIVILETGMGGALDATNIIDAPLLAVITNIGLEHTQFLGNTVEEIARTKGGIIKKGCECVCYDSHPDAVRVIQELCTERGVPFHRVSSDIVTPLASSLTGQEFSYRNNRYVLSLLGDYQLHNAATVLTACEILKKSGWKISDEHIRLGLARVSWPARMEILSTSPLFILDGGHNPQCVDALVDSLTGFLPGRTFTFIAGVLEDKDYRKMIASTLPVAHRFLCLTPDSPRALSGETLAQTVRSMGGNATVCVTCEEALASALALEDTEHPIVCFGSLYLAGQIRAVFPDISHS